MPKTARAHAALLIGSAREALEIARGTRRPSRTYTARDVLVESPPAYSAGQIRAIRAALAVSQPVFANLLNVSERTVHSWEQGTREPDGPTLRLLELAKEDPAVLMRRIVLRRPARRALRSAKSHPSEKTVPRSADRTRR